MRAQRSASSVPALDIPVEGELAVFYQPIFSLRDQTVVSLEALVRGRTRTGHLIGAPRVLAQADTPERRLALDLTVLRQACVDVVGLLAEREALGAPSLHAVNVNLTPTTLVHPGLAVAVADILEETGLPPAYLRLEIPETAAFGELAEATQTLRAITGTGVSLTLDDVGVEAIGLRYLKSLTIDGIKIDRSFITRMLGSASDLAVIRLLVDLCAGLEIRLTAEGVERCEQVEVARGLGVRAIQGYHVSRPLALEALRQLLAQGLERVCRPCFARRPETPQAPNRPAGRTPAQRAAVPSW